MQAVLWRGNGGQANPPRAAMAAVAAKQAIRVVEDIADKGLCNSSVGGAAKLLGLCREGAKLPPTTTNTPQQPQMMSAKRASRSNSTANVGGQIVPFLQTGVVVNRNSIKAINGGLRITRRDHINDLYGAQIPGKVWAYQLNPMSGFSFPFLQNLTKNFQRFRFVSAKIEYVPSIDATHSGSVTMAYFASAKQAVPRSQEELVQTVGSVVGPITTRVGMAGNLKQGKTLKYLQLDPYAALASVGLNNAVQQGQFDAELYAAGIFVVNVSNCADQAGANYGGLLGQLFLEYTLELVEPIWTMTRQAQVENSTWTSVVRVPATTIMAAGADVWRTSNAAVNYFNSNVAFPESDSFLETSLWGTVDGKSIWFPQPGLWKVDMQFVCTSTLLTQFYLYTNPLINTSSLAFGVGVSYQWTQGAGPYLPSTSSQYAVITQPVTTAVPPSITPGYLSWTVYIKTIVPNAVLYVDGVWLSNSTSSQGAVPDDTFIVSTVNVSPGAYLAAA